MNTEHDPGHAAGQLRHSIRMRLDNPVQLADILNWLKLYNLGPEADILALFGSQPDTN
jgi:hypothetical protein